MSYNLCGSEMVMSETKEIRCEMPPMFRFTWPGRDEAYICLEHAEKLKSIANALGFHLQLIPVSGWQEQAEHQCNQFVKTKENA